MSIVTISNATAGSNDYFTGMNVYTSFASSATLAGSPKFISRIELTTKNNVVTNLYKAVSLPTAGKLTMANFSAPTQINATYWPIMGSSVLNSMSFLPNGPTVVINQPISTNQTLVSNVSRSASFQVVAVNVTYGVPFLLNGEAPISNIQFTLADRAGSVWSTTWIVIFAIFMFILFLIIIAVIVWLAMY